MVELNDYKAWYNEELKKKNKIATTAIKALGKVELTQLLIKMNIIKKDWNNDTYIIKE